jgi:amino acid adenylation domain-containing protein
VTDHAPLIARIVKSGTAAPDAVAVVVGEERLTYRGLLDRAVELAGRLVIAGVEEGTPVGVEAARRADYVVAVVATMLAGGHFVPLDPSHPQARLQALARRADIRVGVGTEEALGFLNGVVSVHPTTGAPVPEQRLMRWPDVRDVPVAEGASEALAYTLFTSGSSGEPKIVSIEQRSVCALLDGFDSVAPPGETLIVSALCPFSFDVSIWEIFGALARGGAVVILQQQTIVDPELLAHTLRREGVSSAYIPPALLEPVADEMAKAGDVGSLRRLLTGVEPIPQRTLQRYLDLDPSLAVVNGYGPTETTICATLHRFEGADDLNRRTPIGRPIPGWLVEVHGVGGVAVGVGGVGEIVVGGVGVARGYVGDPVLSGERFWVDGGGVRWYRTGDLGRWLPGGVLEFVGRADDQVKVRGFRVELGEVEAALTGVPGVGSAVVLAVAGAGGVRLVGHVTGAVQERGVREWLGRVLPDYLVPSRVLVWDRLPLTVNGKVDREALAAASDPRSGSSPSGAVQGLVDAGRVGPGLARLWCEVLELPSVDPDVSFFDLGGDSLLAITLINRVLHEFGRSLPYSRLLACRTLNEMADALGEARSSCPAFGDSPVPTDQVTAELLNGATAPLSYGQEGLWARQSISAEDLAFVLPVALRVRPMPGRTLPPTRNVTAAVERVLQAHEAFGLCLVPTPEGIRQQYQLPAPVEVAPAGSDIVDAWRRLAREIAALQGTLARACVVEEDDAFLVLLVASHIVIDGGSVKALVDDLAAALDGRSVAGSRGVRAFARRQRLAASSPRAIDARNYWSGVLAGGVEALELPIDRPRGATRSDRGDVVEVRLGEAAATSLAALAARNGCTTFAAVTAALLAVVHRYTGQSRLTAAVATATDRAEPSVGGSVGYFANLIPLCLTLPAEMPFAEFLGTVSGQLRQGLVHGWLPFEEILSALPNPRGDLAAALTRFVIAQDIPWGSPVRTRQCSIDEAQVNTGTAAYECTVLVRIEGNDVRLHWEFSTDLLDRETVERWAFAFRRLVDQATAQPGTAIGAVDLATEEDRRLLAFVNLTATDYPVASLAELFEENARLYPGVVAIRSRDLQLTYGELDAWSAGLAEQLVKDGVGVETPVVVLCERSAAAVAAILAVIRAGGSYVPLDRRNPAARVRIVQETVGARHALATPGLADRLPAGMRVHLIDRLSATYRTRPGRALPTRRPDQRAYVMFTSGSTGRPKGVEIEDRSIVRLVRAQAAVPLGIDDVLVLASNLAFDAATLEIWGSLLNGGRLVVPEDETVGDPRELARLIRDSGVTAGFFNVSVFRMMIEAEPSALAGMHTILVGGEVVPPALVEEASRVLRPESLVNGYGPTENTTFSCFHRNDPGAPARRTFPIGRPLSNSLVEVHGVGGVAVGVGGVGEIVVGGVGVARGYVGDPVLSGERFWVDGGGVRWYRTGDLGRWLPGGVLEFVGRADDQVKVRGFRVELGEVEAALTGVPGVGSAVVLAVAGAGGVRLVGHVTGAVQERGVREWLGRVLPDYLVPSRVLVWDRLPLTVNGKVDREALAAASDPRSGSSPSGAVQGLVDAGRVGPGLARLWCEVLDLPSVDPDANFFDLGGDSRGVALLVARMRQELGCDLKVLDVLEAATLARLSARLESMTAATDVDASPLAVATRRAAARARRRR